MKYLISILLVCVRFISVAQTNYVKNPDLEQYSICPDQLNNVVYCTHWSNIIDTVSTKPYQPEYYNACGNKELSLSRHIPRNAYFYQYPHSDSGMVGLVLYYDKTPPPFSPFDYRDYLQGRLYKALTAGRQYCVSFWVVRSEVLCYAHNKIGAYLDDGSINALPLPPGSEVNTVVPQVYTDSIIRDTLHWVKISGSFTASGTETHISIGNFFPNAAVDTEFINFAGPNQYSYYLIDDVSVVATDSKANAGPDRWVEQGSSIQIGPVEDSTARGMDCHWYYKGALIDSGNVITVNANAIKYAVDTYIVVQNVCGIITRDTMTLRTVGLGVASYRSGIEATAQYTMYPNPNEGSFVLQQKEPVSQDVSIKVYDALGRMLYSAVHVFQNGKTALRLSNCVPGVYLVCIGDAGVQNPCIRFTIK